MSLTIEKSALFHADVTDQFRWYFKEGGEELAWRFFKAVDMTVLKLSGRPEFGHKRRFRHPLLQDLWSYRVEPPFGRYLIFYRSDSETLRVWRLMHGARDLPRRLVEPGEAA
jgi:toxin ParE1/3/4